MAGLLPSLPGPVRLLRQLRSSRVASAGQQASSAPSKRALTWGAGEARPDSNGPTSFAQDDQLTAASPMDVVVEDLRFLQAKTGLDLITPLQEVKEVHDQVCVHQCSCETFLYISSQGKRVPSVLCFR